MLRCNRLSALQLPEINPSPGPLWRGWKSQSSFIDSDFRAWEPGTGLKESGTMTSILPLCCPHIFEDSSKPEQGRKEICCPLPKECWGIHALEWSPLSCGCGPLVFTRWSMTLTFGPGTTQLLPRPWCGLPRNTDWHRSCRLQQESWGGWGCLAWRASGQTDVPLLQGEREALQTMPFVTEGPDQWWAQPSSQSFPKALGHMPQPNLNISSGVCCTLPVPNSSIVWRWPMSRGGWWYGWSGSHSCTSVMALYSKRTSSPSCFGHSPYNHHWKSNVAVFCLKNGLRAASWRELSVQALFQLNLKHMLNFSMPVQGQPEYVIL